MSPAMSKKLVYVLNYVHPQDTQHFVHVIALLRMLESSFGWQITLLSEKGGSGEQFVHGMKVSYLSRNGGIFRLLSLVSTLFKLRRSGYKLVFVRITKPAAIVSSIAGKFLGMKSLYWQSSANFDLDRQKKFFSRWGDDLLVASIVNSVDRFVTGPEHMLDYYERFYKVPREKLLLLYNDVDLSRFTPSPQPRPLSNKIQILFVHSLSPSKNAALYIPSIVEELNILAMRGWRIDFNLIGSGPEKAIIAEQILTARSGVDIRMLGAVPNTDLPGYLALADIFIMPSYREGMPRALMEAMAMGLPCVSTDAGGTRDVVGPKQLEYVVSRDDPGLFAKKVVELIQNIEARRALSVENLERIKRYDTRSVAAMYDQELSELL